MPRGTTLRNVRIDDERWEALREIAEEGATTRSELIRDMIDERIAARG